MSRREFVLGRLAATPVAQPDGGIIINISQLNIAHAGGRLTVTGTDCGADRMDSKERLRHYRVCHAIAKQLDLYPEMRKYMREKWQEASMRGLPDHALRKLLRYMQALESKASEAR